MFAGFPAFFRALSSLSKPSGPTAAVACAWSSFLLRTSTRQAHFFVPMLDTSASMNCLRYSLGEVATPRQVRTTYPSQLSFLRSLGSHSTSRKGEAQTPLRTASSLSAKPASPVTELLPSITRMQKTDDEHPLGEGKLEWPFHAKAFYVGKEIGHRVNELMESAAAYSFPRAGSRENPLICLTPNMRLTEREGPAGLPCASYIIVFDRMESVVFINGRGKEKFIWHELTDGQLSAKYTEEYRVSVMPDLDDGDVRAADCIVLERAEFNNIRTLAYVLAQTVALHFYETQVDRMLRKFEDMNVEMERSSSFRPAMRKEELLRMVARNNLLITAIISRLSVMERFDLAWKNPDCNKVYEHLLEELEIEDRYSNLQLKLNMVQENFRYFLELIQNQKSDLLEWIIIILIGGEISLNLYELFMK